MDKLKIGEVIYTLRKDKGITQEQLADFIGVSSAAVSKWESATSYPDITLLPALATFLNVSIDKLLNFNVELSADEANKIYTECIESFNKDEFEIAFEKSKHYVNKFSSSYSLKFTISSLIFTNAWRVETQERVDEVIRYIIELNEDIATNCNDIKLVEPALFCLGSLYSSNGEHDKAIQTLNKIHKSQCNPDDILAHIYLEQSKIKEGRSLLQWNLFKAISDISLSCMSLANSYVKVEKDFCTAERYHRLVIELKKLIQGESVDVLSLWFEYYFIAEHYLIGGKEEKAIESLNLMIESLKKYPVDIYNKINNVWCLNSVDIKEKQITMDIYENLLKMLDNPQLDTIRETNEFKVIIGEVEQLKDKYEKDKIR